MLADLIARLEAATGPAEDLDRAIWHATHPGETPFGWPVAIYPHYTASIDAAVTLSDWVLIHASDLGADGFPLVILGNSGTGEEARGIAYGGCGRRLLPVAACIAALRARAGGDR